MAIRAFEARGRTTDARLVREQVTAMETTHRKHYRGAEVALLRKGVQVAEQLHHGQRRSSGEPFVTHPIAVAHIVAELGLDTRTVVAALLHDTVEDTPYTLSALRDDFGHTVCGLVDGVTKLDKIYFGEAAEAETFRKMILAARTDIRVLILKIADRLHNMRTLRHKAGTSRDRTATVTRDIIIPLADRLGLYTLRRELEDLVLATLQPTTYQTIDNYIDKAAPARSALVATAQRNLTVALRRSAVRAKIQDRPRHHYSIHREMLKHPQLGPQSPVRLVIIVSGQPLDCYAALGAVHRTWKPIPGKFHDLIAAPKRNLYQSLHTTVIGPGDQPMDILVRTRHMHHTAEFGIAADLGGPHPTKQPEWLARLLAWQQVAPGPAQFLESLRNDLTYQQITIHTGEGATIVLPAGSTAVDLAYHLDPDTADRLVSAASNGRPTPLTAALTQGAIVELTLAQHGRYPGPSWDWLHTARTTHARLQITQVLHEDESTPLDQQIRAGRVALADALRRRDRALPNHDALPAAHCGYPDPEALFLAIHQGKLAPDDVADLLIEAIDNNVYLQT